MAHRVANAGPSAGSVTWSVVYLLLLVYRTMVGELGRGFVTAFTSLGDAHRYETKSKMSFNDFWFTNSTATTDTLGTIFQTLSFGNVYGVTFWFQLVAFVGLVRFLESFDPRHRLWALVLVLTPSFTLWSSVPSKEAIVVFAMGIVCGYVVRYFRGQSKLDWLDLLGLYVLLVFKPQYFAAVAFLIAAIYARRNVRQQALLCLVAGLLSLIPLYLLRDLLSELAFTAQYHFNGVNGGGSTRDAFFIAKYDVLTKAFEGMFWGFFGPTWAEAQLSIVHLTAFFESALLILILLLVAARSLTRTSVYGVIVMSFTTFWILFGTYPLAIMNPGSAIRYRTGYLLLLFTVAILMSEAVQAIRRPKQAVTPTGKPHLALAN